MEEEPIATRNKPSDSAFKQQKLPAWQPILTADTVLPTFFLIGIAFIPIGVGLLISSNQVQEKVIDYTNCLALNRNETCAQIIQTDPGRRFDCECQIPFTLSEDFQRDVFIYYGLTNFYQNHRRYVRSRDDSQLYGFRTLSKDCEPYAHRNVDGKLMPIAPCGAIANSMFNDTFTLFEAGASSSSSSVPNVVEPESNAIDTVGFSNNDRLIAVFRTGIAWATDKSGKFRNPPGVNISEAFKDYAAPPNWETSVDNLDPLDANDNGFLNEAFIVWMRTAALPSFRKLYARIDHSSAPKFHHSLPRGSYKINIKYNFPVTHFQGTKKIIISNTSWLGGKNPFLGIAYIIIGAICLILSALFLFVHKKYGKKTSDLISVNSRTSYVK